MTEIARFAERRRLQGCCIDCGRKYGEKHGFPDLVVPDDVWRAISPTEDGGGLLCPACMCRRAHDEGIRNVKAKFMSGPFCCPAEQSESAAGGEATELTPRQRRERSYWLRDLNTIKTALEHNQRPTYLLALVNDMIEAIRQRIGSEGGNG